MPIPDGALSVGPNFEAIDGLVGDRGTPCEHSIALPCTCMQYDPSQGMVGTADPTCDKCFGQGYLYRDSMIFTAILASLSGNRMWAQVGWVQPGDISCSPPTYYRRIGNFDKVMISMPVPVDGQVLVRGVVSPFSPRPADLSDNEDFLYWEAARMEAAYLEDENGVVYEVGTYLLEGRKIRWAPGAGPRKGLRYSIKYEAYPEFVAWTVPIDRWDHRQELGQRILLRRVVFQADPTRRQIEPPLEFRSAITPEYKDNPYSSYGNAPTTGVDPSK